MLRPGFKTTEFWMVLSYILSKNFNIDLGQIVSQSEVVVEAIDKTSGDTNTMLFVGGYVLYRFATKWIVMKNGAVKK